jgi:DNA polymerase III subunit delta'
LFESIVGHKDTLNILKNHLKNKLSHCYLFYGNYGIGKSLIAKEFAKQILKTYELSNCLEFKYITKLENKKDILVEQIREEILKDIYVKPLNGDKKVYIIDNAESLNESSSNALLKTLEEPPEYVVIIIITSNISEILPTILSRANKIYFSDIEKSEVAFFIKKEYGIDLKKEILDFTEGSISIIKDIIQDNRLDSFNFVDKIYNDIREKNVVKSLIDKENIDFKEKYVIEYLQYLFYTNKQYSCVEIVEDMKKRFNLNGNYDIITDNMILRCIESM